MLEQEKARAGEPAAVALPDIAPPLLAWYHAHRRVLPFRERPTPYRVWVSEIMLQQTRMETALPYFERFVAELPDVRALAACDEERLRKLWQGLGYYNRARNLQKAARVVLEKFDGDLPAEYDALLALPGVGPYTAGAVASIAFGQCRPAVDGNVLRVAARLLACEEEVTAPATKAALTAAVAARQPAEAPGDYNQALMELGALVCLPSANGPRCAECPLAATCQARVDGTQALLPRKAPPKAKREVPVCILLVRKEADTAGGGWQTLIRQRPGKGLLASMWEPPLWEEQLSRAQAQERLAGLWREADTGAVELGPPLAPGEHVFTHRVWRMYGWEVAVRAGTPAPDGWVWATEEDLLRKYAIPAAFTAWLPSRM